MTLMPFVTTMRPARVIGRWRARRRPVAQAGQALIELLIGATVLVPFVVLLVWLGKVQSLQQAANAAARVLAFECSVRPEACAQSSQHPELADEIRSIGHLRSYSEGAEIFAAGDQAGFCRSW